MPRYFLFFFLSLHADRFLPAPFALPVFLSFMTLFVYVHSGWKSQSQEDAARNGAAPPSTSHPSSLAPFCVFFFFRSRSEMQQPGARSGFPSELTVSVLCVSVYVGKEPGGGGGEVVRGGPRRVTPP